MDSQQLAALAAHLGGPEPLIGITCMALAELAAARETGARAQAQLRPARGSARASGPLAARCAILVRA